jgi:anhydro-N-acetylmuramic acid kinase
MNPSLIRLADLAQKPRSIIGLMSGTSLDGLDIVLCEVSGHGLSSKLDVKQFLSIAYSDEFLSILRPVFANPQAPLSDVTRTNAWIAREHAKMITNALAKWGISNTEVDILASHGQTIFHAPNILELKSDIATEDDCTFATASLQIGDGDHLAFLTQIITVSDFRQKHIAAGGEGAPLVPYADYLLFSDTSESRILINVGGIANFTYLPSNKGFDSVVSADSGPGNTMMDVLIQHVNTLKVSNDLPTGIPQITKPYDANGDFAAKGNIDETLLNIMIAKSTEVANSSTGQETYNIDFISQALNTLMQESYSIESYSIESYSIESDPTESRLILRRYLSQHKNAFFNLIATLNFFTAKTISLALGKLPLSKDKLNPPIIYLSGGGVHNSVLINNIQKCVGHIPVKTCTELGINADAKEAALFAILANQAIYGSNDVFANKHGIPATSFGKISLP